MTSDSTRDLLQRRAWELARPLGGAAGPGARQQVMRLRLGEQRFAVPLDRIRQVVPLTGAARLPRAAAPLVALAPVAGHIVPVVAVGPDAALPDGTPWAVAVASGDAVACLPTDEVIGIVDLRDSDVMLENDQSWYARGLTQDGDILLDVDLLLVSIGGQPTSGIIPDGDDRHDVRKQG